MAGRGAVGVTFGWRPGVDGSESHRAQSLSGPHQGASAPTGRPNGPLLHGGGGGCFTVWPGGRSIEIGTHFQVFQPLQADPGDRSNLDFPPGGGGGSLCRSITLFDAKLTVFASQIGQCKKGGREPPTLPPGGGQLACTRCMLSPLFASWILGGQPLGVCSVWPLPLLRSPSMRVPPHPWVQQSVTGGRIWRKPKHNQLFVCCSFPK